MSDMTKRQFAELALDGHNFLTWTLDVEIHLASNDLSDTIIQDSESALAQKAQVLIFLRHHLNQDLKNEYLTEKDHSILWTSLEDRFQQQNDVILPQAQYDWLNLRFQDFKYATEYNSVLHRIVSQLKLCQQTVTDAELLQKTLSTFHTSNLVLQQQYMAKNYTTHSELISALLVAEKHNKLLMNNHNTRPVGSQAVLEAHAARKNFRWRKCGREFDANMRRGSTRGRGRSRGRGRGRGLNDAQQNAKDVQTQGHGKCVSQDQNSTPQSSSRFHNKQVSFKCGCDDYWSHTCRTPKHLVEAYQRMLRDNKEKTPQGESHHTNLPEADFDKDEDDLLGDNMTFQDFGDNE